MSRIRPRSAECVQDSLVLRCRKSVRTAAVVAFMMAGLCPAAKADSSHSESVKASQTTLLEPIELKQPMPTVPEDLLPQPAGTLSLGTGDTADLIRNYDVATQRMKDLGMDSVRLAINWSRAQPAKNATPDFESLPEISDKLVKDGFEVNLLLWDQPSWASHEYCRHVSLPREQETQRITRTIMDKFSGDWLQLLNEVNIVRIEDEVCAQKYRKGYADLAKAVAPIVHTKGRKLAASGLYRGNSAYKSTSPYLWVEDMAKYNAPLDAVAVHPYPVDWRAWAGAASQEEGTVDMANLNEWTDHVLKFWPSYEAFTKTVPGRVIEKIFCWRPGKKAAKKEVKTRKELLRKKRNGWRCRSRLVRGPDRTISGYVQKPVPEIEMWVGEMGYLSDTDMPNRRPEIIGRLVTEEQQAEMTAKALSSVINQNRYISKFSWFLMEDDVTWTSGLFRHDDTEKPAYETWKQYIANYSFDSDGRLIRPNA